MKSPTQKLMEEFGLYLRMVREKKRKSLKYVSQALKYNSSTFLSRIENGQACIPLDRVVDFVWAYDIPVPDFVRLVLSIMHEDTYKALINILVEDKEFAEAAYRCHTTADSRKRHAREKEFNPGLVSRSFQKMRSFIVENPELIPDGKWSKRSFLEPVE